jgi:hypothetical protein
MIKSATNRNIYDQNSNIYDKTAPNSNIYEQNSNIYDKSAPYMTKGNTHIHKRDIPSLMGTSQSTNITW